MSIFIDHYSSRATLVSQSILRTWGKRGDLASVGVFRRVRAGAFFSYNNTLHRLLIDHLTSGGSMILKPSILAAMRKVIAITCVTLLSACVSQQTNTSRTDDPAFTSKPTLVGAWEVTASRARGVGKNLLTFSSDGTFFRSGDTHPVLSGAHGAWKVIEPNLYNSINGGRYRGP